jgi:hypothetical protein
MKNFLVLIFLVFLITGCKDTDDDPFHDFPDCVGIESSLNPYSIVKPYSGKIWGSDTVIYTQFIFTDYVNYNLLFSAERSWNMYIKFTSGTTTKYQSSNCYYSFTDKKYFAWSGFDYRGNYSTWDFKFDVFDCSKLSGSILVIQPEVQDTLEYRFEGNR